MPSRIDEKQPLSPDILIDALQDRVHPSCGKLIVTMSPTKLSKFSNHRAELLSNYILNNHNIKITKSSPK